MRVAVLLCLVAAGLCSISTAQVSYDAAIFCHTGPVLLFDSATAKVTSVIPQPGTLAAPARGGCFGPAGFLYASVWGTTQPGSAPGIDVLDPILGQWIPALQVKDPGPTPSFRIMGAPYTPCPNYDNMMGFGIMCVDGNPPPSSLNPPANSRNTFLVDYSTATPTFRVDGIFPDTNIPMSDFFPNPHGAGFIGVGFYTNDQKVSHYPVANPARTPITVKTIASLPFPSMYDATVAEDGKIYTLSNGFMLVIDVLTSKVNTVATSGLPGGWCAMWSDPWEKPGMDAYVAQDGTNTIHKVDLSVDPMVSTQIYSIGKSYSINTGRHAEECQLCSWKSSTTGKRNFHINFGPNALGQWCILVPSLSGMTKMPLVVNGLQIHLLLDNASFLGLQGFLPYNFTAALGTSGEVDILWNGFGSELGIRSYWQAVTFNKNGVFTDVSNIINVGL